MLLSSLALNLGPDDGFTYDDAVQLRVMAAPIGPASPLQIALTVEFALLPGAAAETRGKICWKDADNRFDPCTGDDALCPRRPPPPNTAPPGGPVRHVLSFAQAPFAGGLFALGGDRGVLRFGPGENVVGRLTALLGAQPVKPLSFHVFKVLEVHSWGDHSEAEFADMFLAIPVHDETPPA